MSSDEQQPKPRYRCVNCGEESKTIVKYNSPTVIKLSKCDVCNGKVDKYVEYDSVIVMIDLVLVSREAQRHVLYNTDFKSYWKLLIILILLETYGMWKKDSMMDIVVGALCGYHHHNNTSLLLPDELRLPAMLADSCWAWSPSEQSDENDLFIWEKNFYMHFAATFCGIAAFLVTTLVMMSFMKRNENRKPVSFSLHCKAFCLSNASAMFTIPMLVWGVDCSLRTHALHFALALLYATIVFYNVYSVVYGQRTITTVLVLTISCKDLDRH